MDDPNYRVIGSNGKRRLNDAALAPYTHWLGDDTLFVSWMNCGDGRTLDEFTEDRKCELSSILCAPTCS